MAQRICGHLCERAQDLFDAGNDTIEIALILSEITGHYVHECEVYNGLANYRRHGH